MVEVSGVQKYTDSGGRGVERERRRKEKRNEVPYIYDDAM